MKIFIYPHTNDNFHVKWSCPRTELIIQEGFSKIPEVELVDSELVADYIIFHHVPQNHGQKSFELINKIDPKKLIIVDSIDENDQYFLPELNPDKYFLYFKRSLIKVDQQGNRSRISCVERQYPWDYAILDGMIQPAAKKDIDVGCYLRNSCNYRYATLINTYNWSLKNPQYSCYIGECSKGSRSDENGTVYFDSTYFDFLARTEIVISSGPWGWCGDSRGAEAVANKCLYMSNEFFDLMPNPPQDFYHWIKINPFNKEDFEYKLTNIVEGKNWNSGGRYCIKEYGFEHCMKYHTSEARCRYILEKIEENR